MRPGSAESEAALTASRPPKRRDTLSTERSGSAMGHLAGRCGLRAAQQTRAQIGERSDQSARRETNDEHQPRAVNHKTDPSPAAGDEFAPPAEELPPRRPRKSPKHSAAPAD